MGRAIAAWGFGATFTQVTAGAIYTAFIRQIGASVEMFGLLAAALPLMSVMQVLAARLVERSGRSKRQMLLAGLLGRSLWIVMPLLPLLSHTVPGLVPRAMIIPFILIGVLISGACQAFTTPAFFTWMTHLVPSAVRPAFFAQRTVVGTSVVLFVVPLTNWISDQYQDPRINAVILALAGVAGVMDIVLFLGVAEQPRARILKMPPLVASFREPLRDPAIRNFLLFVWLFTFSAGIFGPFAWLHALETLHHSKFITGLLLGVGPFLGIALTSRYWGELAKRFGNRPVIQLTSATMVFSPLCWVLALPASAGPWNSWVPLFVSQFFFGALAGGLDIACQTVITRVAPSVPRSTITALFFMAWGSSFALGSGFGGVLAHWLGDEPPGIFGTTITNYQVLFLIAHVVRLGTAAFVTPHLREPGARGTRETLRTIIPDGTQTFAARVARPFGSRER